ncbi:MAG TPA: N-acetyltransferase [Rhizomicrobium sp.]|nr:N-acetyltransferase [Rhizomicrobium sp.]
MFDVNIRNQIEADFAAVHELVIAAFKTLPIAAGTEQFIMDALWRTGAAAVALVAEDVGRIVGQAAFSKVLVGGRDVGWHGCGPVSVLPTRHRQGIGSALMRAGLDRLRALGSKGCVVVGHPDYYPRFGFANTDAMSLPGVPPEAFMAIRFEGEMPRGEVTFDKAFEATG